MDAALEKEYDAFRERVKRTIYIDNLSPQVNETVLQNAFNQYAAVKCARIIPNSLRSETMGRCALVEFGTPEQARAIREEVIGAYPFMVSGIPRPVRALPATPEMFDDRPAKPDRKMKLQWINPSDPDFQAAQKLKRLVKKHAAEASCLLKQQLAEEEKLAKQQAEALKANHEKYTLIDGVMADGSTRRLGSYYNVNAMED